MSVDKVSPAGDPDVELYIETGNLGPLTFTDTDGQPILRRRGGYWCVDEADGVSTRIAPDDRNLFEVQSDAGLVCHARRVVLGRLPQSWWGD